MQVYSFICITNAILNIKLDIKLKYMKEFSISSNFYSYFLLTIPTIEKYFNVDDLDESR